MVVHHDILPFLSMQKYKLITFDNYPSTTLIKIMRQPQSLIKYEDLYNRILQYSFNCKQLLRWSSC